MEGSQEYIDILMQDCSNSSALAELLQSFIKSQIVR